ncbi:uncharacterized protein UTRI_04543 [Ustilago trichophora]|uniref:Uncharacterized protein n=1 Tax=Ustilago trichophora TaxID=86804 RepID=A0A5C3EF48_9BASI|nr:uncharacterized protein UTRI_04543 [Ustilago trichophora]
MKLFFARVAMILALISLIATAPLPAVPGEEEAHAIRPSADTGAPVPPETSNIHFPPAKAGNGGDTMILGRPPFAAGEVSASPETSLAATGHSSVPSEASPIMEGITDKSGQSRPRVEAGSLSSSKKHISKFRQKVSSKLHRWWDPWQPAFSNLEMEKLLQKLPEKPAEYQKVIEMTQDLPHLDGKKILTLGRNPSFDRSAILKMMNERQPFFVKGGKGKFWSFDLSSDTPDAHFIWTDKIPKEELSRLKQAARPDPVEAIDVAREGAVQPGTATQTAPSLGEETMHTTIFPRPGAEAGDLSVGASEVSPAAADQHSVAPEGLSVTKASETLPEGIWPYPVRPGTLEADEKAEWRNRLSLKLAEKKFRPISSNYGMLTLINEHPQLKDSETDVRGFLDELPRVNGKPVLTLSGDPIRDRRLMALMTKEGKAFYVKGGRGKVWSFIRSTVPGQASLIYTDQISEEELKMITESTATKLAETAQAARQIAEGSAEATGGARGAAETATEAATAENSVVSEAESVDLLRPGMPDGQGRIIPKLDPKNLVPYRGPWYKPGPVERLSPANERMAKFLNERPLDRGGLGYTAYPMPATDKGVILKLSRGNDFEAATVTALTKEGDPFYVVDQDNHVFRFKPSKDEPHAFTWTDDVKKTQKLAVKKALKDFDFKKNEAIREAMKERGIVPAESSHPWLQKATEKTGAFFKDLPKLIHGR